MDKKTIIRNVIVGIIGLIFTILVVWFYLIPTKCAMCQRYILPTFEYSINGGLSTINVSRIYEPCDSCKYEFPLDTINVGSFIHIETINDSLYNEDVDYYQKGLINGNPIENQE